MKANIWSIVPLLTGSLCHGQSLVPNGDFEQYAACPSYWGQIDSALFWTNPAAGTPDYFNECSTFSNTGVPVNGMGNRPAHSGVAYGGIALYDASGVDKREYMETALTAPLIANAIYHVELFASIGFYAQYTTDAIQVYFSDTLIANVNSTSVLPFSPQLSNEEGAFITVSTAPWSSISGEYMAHGGERYLVIGNFKDDASTTLQSSGGGVFNAAYSYIDDVSLSLVTGIGPPGARASSFSVQPNPATDRLTVELPAGVTQAEIRIHDLAGALQLATTTTHQRTDLSVAKLANGAYLIEVRTGITIGRQEFIKE